MLFKPEMILALLNTKPDVWPAEPLDPGQPFKWQTRREIKDAPNEILGFGEYHPTKTNKRTGEAYPGEKVFGCWTEDDGWVCPHPVGTILYARETFLPKASGEIFRADFDSIEAAGIGGMYGGWKPGIHMPKTIARLWFTVDRVRVERVNSITHGDAIAEGIAFRGSNASDRVWVTAVDDYRELFDRINGTGAFERGDWCWVYDLKRIAKPCPHCGSTTHPPGCCAQDGHGG